MPLIALGVAGAVAGGIGSAVAGSEQAGAAKSAAQLQADEAAQSLAFQKQEWNTQQQNLAPFLKAGTQAEGELSDLTSTPGQGLLTPWTEQFKAPTAAEAKATPGYQFIREQGNEALQRSAAASGGLLTGGTAKALDQFNTGLADTTYGETYSRALQEYQTAYNTFQNNQTNTFNRLATQAGVGQTTASTLGNQGQAAASTVAGINSTAGTQIGQNINNAGAATASGYSGVANAVTSGFGNIQGLLTLQDLMKDPNKGLSA
jgi:hypothetical protein